MLVRRHFVSNEPFVFEMGGRVDSATLVFYTSDREYKPGDKVLWICHALTGNANPEDWWPQMVGPGMLLDPDEYYVVCASMVCSPYGAFCPATPDPASGRPYLLDFPQTTIRDIVQANIRVRRHLGIEKIDLLVGPSIGGFQAVEWAVTEPDLICKAVFLATDIRVSPFVTAFNESQRMAIKADPTFFEQKSHAGGTEGLKCARSIALISYRTAEGYNLTQQEPDVDALIAGRASSYQRHQGDKLIDRGFDAYSYWYLTYALDSHNVGRGRGGVAEALKRVKAKVLVVSITTDMLFPASHGREAASLIPGAQYRELSSVFGHDGFLIENDQLVDILKGFIAD